MISEFIGLHTIDKIDLINIFNRPETTKHTWLSAKCI